jgi:hypothetical protein
MKINYRNDGEFFYSWHYKHFQEAMPCYLTSSLVFTTIRLDPSQSTVGQHMYGSSQTIFAVVYIASSVTLPSYILLWHVRHGHGIAILAKSSVSH